MTNDKLGDFIIKWFEVLAYGTHYVLSELAWWLIGKVLGIPSGEWDWLGADD